MTNFRPIFFALITILVVSNCTPTKLTYINVSDEKIATTDQQKNQKLDLINENNSPLHRIMSIFSTDIKLRRFFKNNISAFHIGNGIVVSVAQIGRASCRERV